MGYRDLFWHDGYRAMPGPILLSWGTANVGKSPLLAQSGHASRPSMFAIGGKADIARSRVIGRE